MSTECVTISGIEVYIVYNIITDIWKKFNLSIINITPRKNNVFRV